MPDQIDLPTLHTELWETLQGNSIFSKLPLGMKLMYKANTGIFLNLMLPTLPFPARHHLLVSAKMLFETICVNGGYFTAEAVDHLLPTIALQARDCFTQERTNELIAEWKDGQAQIKHDSLLLMAMASMAEAQNIDADRKTRLLNIGVKEELIEGCLTGAITMAEFLRLQPEVIVFNLAL